MAFIISPFSAFIFYIKCVHKLFLAMTVQKSLIMGSLEKRNDKLLKN